jgi:hypothetical protein
MDLTNFYYYEDDTQRTLDHDQITMTVAVVLPLVESPPAAETCNQRLILKDSCLQMSDMKYIVPTLLAFQFGGSSELVLMDS